MYPSKKNGLSWAHKPSSGQNVAWIHQSFQIQNLCNGTLDHPLLWQQELNKSMKCTYKDESPHYGLVSSTVQCFDILIYLITLPTQCLSCMQPKFRSDCHWLDYSCFSSCSWQEEHSSSTYPLFFISHSCRIHL